MSNPVITEVSVGSNYSVNDSARVHATLALTMIVSPASLRVNYPTTVNPTVLLVRNAGGSQTLAVPAPAEQTGTIAAGGGVTRSIRWRTTDSGSTRQLTINVEDPAFTATNESWTLKISALPPATSITIAILDQATITQIEADPVINLVTPTVSGKESEIKPLQARAGRYTIPPLPIPASLPMGCPGVTMSWSQVIGDPVVGTLTPLPPSSTTFLNPNGTSILGCEQIANLTLPGLGSTPSVTLNYRIDATIIDATIGEFSNSKTATVTVTTRTRHAMLILDRSGSMSSGAKWENAFKGAYIWLDLLTAFRRGISANDRVGIMTFTDDRCSFRADDTSISSDNRVVFPTVDKLAPLPTPPEPASLDLEDPDSCTPIGDALKKALDTMATDPDLPDKTTALYGILLLTDGIENSGTVKIDPVATTLGDVELFDSIRNSGARSIFRFKPDLNPNTQLYTVGVGADGSVRPEVLSKLAYGDVSIPSAPNGYYRLVSNVKDLIPSLVEMLSKFLTAAHMDIFPTPPPFTAPAAPGIPDPENPPAGTAVYFRVPAGEQKLVVVLVWNSSGDDLELTWRVQPAPGAPATSFNVVPSGAIVVAKRASHGVASINDLSSVTAGGTEWRVRYKPGGVAPAAIDPTNVLAARDLRVRTEIIFDRAQYRTEQSMKIEARMFAGSEPITEGRVVVELARPGESLGTFFVLNSQLINQPRLTATTTSATTVGKGDPLSPKVALLQQLLDLKDMNALPVLTPQTIFADGTNELYDDGTHGDGIANDGIYANTYTNTDMEGTYTFRFHLSGRTPDGSYFADTITLSRWVGVNVDPNASIVTIQTGIPVDNRRFLGARVSVIPKSRGGQYLGPFWSHIIRFTTTTGTFQGNLVSEPDGSYSQLLLYRPGELPMITVEVDNQKFPPKPIASGCLSFLLGIPFLRWLLRLLGLIS